MLDGTEVGSDVLDPQVGPISAVGHQVARIGLREPRVERRVERVLGAVSIDVDPQAAQVVRGLRSEEPADRDIPAEPCDPTPTRHGPIGPIDRRKPVPGLRIVVQREGVAHPLRNGYSMPKGNWTVTLPVRRSMRSGPLGISVLDRPAYEPRIESG